MKKQTNKQKKKKKKKKERRKMVLIWKYHKLPLSCADTKNATHDFI